MLSDSGLERVHGLSQLFTQRDCTSRTILLVAKVTDDFLLGGAIAAMEGIFSCQALQAIDVGKVVVDSRFHFNGC